MSRRRYASVTLNLSRTVYAINFLSPFSPTSRSHLGPSIFIIS
ncbi:hypothetical protein A2U01_0093473, partial [Trifolium medium]|nr:hypothetical protein [Trifolium medium]